MNDLSVAEQIKIIMMRRGDTIRDVAKKIGVSPQSLSQNLLRNNFTMSNLEKICVAIGCTCKITIEEVKQ